ncbi:CLUMA_CG005514, isoform A [Clunio marinus]|uniref:CLUMA_CG005514, isoform A n=1 Tax=Clunio marinus TaxID=568069 RepID=A0A1J1HZC1_9DIPT|nr:CLUMA_CG005514, isoform A [Clunio marinus]
MAGKFNIFVIVVFLTVIVNQGYSSPAFDRGAKLLLRILTPNSIAYPKQYRRVLKYLRRIKLEPLTKPSLRTDGKIYKMCGKFNIKGLKKFCQVEISTTLKEITARCGTDIFKSLCQ